MTRENDVLTIERKLVVVFDICSSTTILEDLKQTDHLAEWRNLLIRLKDYILERGCKIGVQIYKFIGDGWILLLPLDISQKDLLGFLVDVSLCFEMGVDSPIRDLLQRPPSPVGLTFGVDAGDLIKIEMNQQLEYIGRALNVATRLQAATKELSGDPSYRVLFSKHSFNSLRPPRPINLDKTVAVKLRNISNGAFCHCFDLYLMGEMLSLSKWGKD